MQLLDSVFPGIHASVHFHIFDIISVANYYFYMAEYCNDKTRILFIDDEVINLMVQKAYFAHSCEVFTALSVDEALDLLRKQDVDVIVSDQMMPVKLGTDLFSELQADHFKGLKVILTAYSQDSGVQKALKEGLVHYVMDKPLQVNEMLNYIEDFKQKRAM